MKILIENWRRFITEGKNEEGKEQGADGKACWDGYKHAGTEDGKDKCVKVEEELDNDLLDEVLNDPREIVPCREFLEKEEMDEAKSPAWQRKAGKNKEGGLNAKGRKSYEKENPGSDLKAPVSAKQAKKSKGGKAAGRRKSFCYRMCGMKKKKTGAKTKRDPDSRINKALRKWDCNC